MGEDVNENEKQGARGVAINVGANTNEPGFRGPIYPDGRFEYVPIPESKPIRDGAIVPTYGDLELATDTRDVTDVPVHLDPTFEGVHGCDRYTYGDPHAVKARPLLELAAGDYVYFYATLSTVGSPSREWIVPEWGAYVIGAFRLARDPISRDAYRGLPRWDRRVYADNAHLKRRSFDAAVLLYGDQNESALFDTALPLSSPDAGIDPNCIVTELSSDSGKGPWWRRPLRFDAAANRELRSILDDGRFDRL